MDEVSEVLLDYHITGLNGVITKRRRIDVDVLRIACRYGDFDDVVYWADRVIPGVPLLKAAQLIGNCCERAGFHPIRLGRRAVDVLRSRQST
jgi:hypothetical protein